MKRRLRMELAAEQGAEHLAAEIDKRLVSLEGSRARVSWRQKPTFLRDLDMLRRLIGERLAGLDPAAALARLWLFFALERGVARRVKDKDGEVQALFGRAAPDLGALLAAAPAPAAPAAAAALVETIVANPIVWAAWLPQALDLAPPALAQAALRLISQRPGAVPGWMSLIRQLADAAGDVEAYAATFTADARRTAPIAADIARRLLDQGRVDEAGTVLGDSTPGRRGHALGAADGPDFAWETVWIDYLEAAGQGDAAQDMRWMSFERTLSADRARAFIRRLADFDDVDAETKAFAFAARHADFARGLQLLMDWPALAEASRMIAARPDEARAPADLAEAWAERLSQRYPEAAVILLRKSAAAAFARRDLASSTRLSAAAEAIDS